MLVMIMKSDLHIHTKYSDGELDEYEVINEVIKSNVKEFAICDHDTIEGSKKVYDLLNCKNVIFTEEAIKEIEEVLLNGKN